MVSPDPKMFRDGGPAQTTGMRPAGASKQTSEMPSPTGRAGGRRRLPQVGLDEGPKRETLPKGRDFNSLKG
jgi:hypothetical protein